MRSSHSPTLLVLTLTLAPFSHAQTADTASNVVQVDAVVTDAKGAAVTDLRAPDFSLTEGGQPRQVISVKYVDGPPAVAFVADSVDSAATADSVSLLLADFVNRRAASAGSVAIMPVTEGSQELTTDKTALYEAIMRIGAVARVQDAITLMGLNQRAEEGAPLYHAVGSFEALRTAVDAMAPLPGRKSVVLITQAIGWPPLQRKELLRALAARANQADVAIYWLDPGRLVFPHEQFAAGSGAADLARATGGLTSYGPDVEFKVSVGQAPEELGGLIEKMKRKAALAVSLDKMLGRMTGGYYLIAYRTRRAGGRAANIIVRVSRNGLTAHWRAAASRAQTRPSPAPLRVRTIPLVSATDVEPKSHRRLLTVRAMVAIDPRGLRFENQPGDSKRATVNISAKVEGGNTPAAAIRLFTKYHPPEPLEKTGTCSITIPAAEMPEVGARTV
ncbi:MAG TPA: VWA domain-containing protein, partial [Bryobacteraceae bacterium]|nr:VWA domain-containing protein [Bryobacteraceae bacterium]